MNSRIPGSEYESTTGFWVHMRGLPFECTEADIFEVSKIVYRKTAISLLQFFIC